MSPNAPLGVFFACLALVAWGAGDFLIQRSARRFGDWAALFYIELFATTILLPFVWSDLAGLASGDWIFLIGLGFILLIAAILDLEALRVGKISVVEPIYALEVGVTAVLSVFVLRELINLVQGMWLLLLIVGIFLVSVKSFRHLRHIHLERGVFMAICATLFMGLVNFLFGTGSRATNPLMVNWVTGAVLLVASVAYIGVKGEFRGLARDWRNGKGLLLGMSLADNTAWISFAYATTYIPIAIATGLSESYIALAALLGVVLNRERLA
ncbi:MAG TPA: DMT family transporter, partial [Candidatus Paceibacterota bacterium]